VTLSRRHFWGGQFPESMVQTQRPLCKAAGPFAQCFAIVTLLILVTLRCDRYHCAVNSLSLPRVFGRKLLTGKHFQLFFLKSQNRSSLTTLKDARFRCPYMCSQLSPSPALFWWETETVPECSGRKLSTPVLTNNVHRK
jgi:hypothetical protein